MIFRLNAKPISQGHNTLIKLLAPFLLPLYAIANIPSSDMAVQLMMVDGLRHTSSDSFSIKTSQHIGFLLSTSEKGETFAFTLTKDTLTITDDSQPPLEYIRPMLFVSGLEKGNYQLEICKWSADTPVISQLFKIQVKSSFLDHWAFFILLGLYLLLLFGGAIYIILLSNNRNKEKLIDLRSDWTNKLHNDVGGDLSSVSMRLDILQRKMAPLNPQINEGVIKTYEVLKDIQKKLRFVFNLVDPKKDSFRVMLEDVIDFAQENLALQQIEFHLENDLPKEIGDKVDIGRINKLYLALKEAINNCIKSSKAKHVYFLISHDKQGLLIEVKDDGVGFDITQTSTGNGLDNLRQYAQEGLIDLTIESEPGKGTNLKMRLLFL